MAQNPTQVSTTPPLPGLTLVTTINGALETIASDFSGSIDPAASSFAYALWADTGTGDLKRRNAANNDWEVIGRIFPQTIENSLGNLGIKTDTPSVSLDINATDAVKMPSGTTAQRPTPEAAMLRFNSDVDKFEGYNGLAWGSIGGGATGGGSDEVFVENSQVVTTNYTIPSTKNAMSTGPIEIDDGVTVTISAGSVWVIL
jgi:hypothetical protein